MTISISDDVVRTQQTVKYAWQIIPMSAAPFETHMLIFCRKEDQ